MKKHCLIILMLFVFLLCSCSASKSPASIDSPDEKSIITDDVSASVYDDFTEAEPKSNEVTEYNKIVYEDKYLSIVCNAIYNDKIVFAVNSKMKNKTISVYLETVALDGLVSPTYYSDTNWPDLKPGESVIANYNAYINNTNHKYMSAFFEVFCDGKGVESISIANFDLGGDENSDFEEPDETLVYDSKNLSIWYVGAENEGIRLRVNNKLRSSVTFSIDSPYYVNQEEVDSILGVRPVPPFSTIDYYIDMTDYNLDYTPSDVKSFACTGYTFIGTAIDVFEISSDKEVPKDDNNNKTHDDADNKSDEDGVYSQETASNTLNSPAYEAYIEATTLNKAQLRKSDSTGNYFYGEIAIVDGDKEWVESPLNKNGSLNHGSLYRSMAKGIEGIDKIPYGMWSGKYCRIIWGIDKPSDKNELQPYIDSVSSFITRKKELRSIIKKFSKLESIDGTFNFETGTADFTITDLSKTAAELGVTEQILGYILADLDEYAFSAEFEGNSYHCSGDSKALVK